jgi:methionine sulfoxide reductase heme-binding subunit
LAAGVRAAILRPMTVLPASLTPWTDRAGRFSPLRAAVFAAVLAPALWLAVKAVGGELGPRPVTAAIHEIGVWAVRLLLLSLLVTPLRTLAHWPQLIGVRRMLGLVGLSYTLVHLTLYVVDQRYDLVKVATEIALRTYLTIGFVAVLGLLALGATSTDGMVRRLGAERWRRLHSITYWITALALAHFFLQRKLDIAEPVLMAGLYLWLMGWRWLHSRRLGAQPLALAALAVAAGAGAMALEAGYYALRNGLPFDRILLANLDFEMMVRPGWWVLTACIAMLVACTALGRLRQGGDRRAPAQA